MRSSWKCVRWEALVLVALPFTPLLYLFASHGLLELTRGYPFSLDLGGCCASINLPLRRSDIPSTQLQQGLLEKIQHPQHFAIGPQVLIYLMNELY